MAALALCVKTRCGQSILKDLTKKHTAADLKEKLCQLAGIKPEALHVLQGFPPKPIDLPSDEVLLESCGIESGDTLIVEEKKLTLPTDDNITQDRLSEQSWNNPALNATIVEPDGILMRKIVPADNSCLFTSIGYVLTGKYDAGCVSYMRQLISETIKSNPTEYSEALLGKPNKNYRTWILQDDAWGGAIELAILSDYYGIEIVVVDTQNTMVNRFGEDKDYGQRVLLIYDGIHYDPLYLEPLQPGAPVQTIFPTSMDSVLQQAQQLAQEAKSSLQFTDVNKFSLKCMQCHTYLMGQNQVQEHAKNTGHTSFGEVPSTLRVLEN